MRQEFRQAYRVLLRRPLFAITAVITLSLGIGANSAVFSIVNSVILRPLDYSDPDRLVVVRRTSAAARSSSRARSRQMWDRLPLSYQNYLDIHEQRPIFEAVGIYGPWGGTFLGGQEPILVEGARISAGLLDAFAVQPLIGRKFSHQEIEGHKRVALLSHAFWQQHYGADRSILGRTIRFRENAYQVVGVMPAGFRISYAQDHQLWLPLLPTEEARLGNRYEALARLRREVSLTQAQAMLTQVARRFEGMDRGEGFRLVPLHEVVVGDARPVLYLLSGVVAIVLLIACGNVSCLLLIENSRRKREIALRLTLGASRWRIVGQLMAECLLLSLAAAAASLSVAWLALPALLGWVPSSISRAGSAALDARVLGLTLALGLVATLVSALSPAMRITKPDLSSELVGASMGERLSRERSRNVLIVAEITLTMLLLVSAGLLTSSYLRLTAVHPGFSSTGVLTQVIRLDTDAAEEPERVRAFYNELLNRLAGLPEVESVGASSRRPFAGGDYSLDVEAAGEESGSFASLESVAEGFFRTMQIPLRRGRLFDGSEGPDGAPVVIINQMLAHSLWSDADPIGRSVTVMGGSPRTVVGVVGNVRYRSLDNLPTERIYVPHSQQPFESMTVILRTSSNPAGLSPALRRTIRTLEKTLPLEQSRSLDDLISESVASPRSRMTLFSLFAGLAAVLAMVGLYGVVAFSVQQRRRQIAIRMALGAEASRVRSMILGQTAKLSLLGIALGTAAALASSRLLSGFLFGVGPADPLTFIFVAVFLAVTALLAGYFPAFRASRIDPMAILRAE
ncbi:MAG TPA: ABC transporter permease [Acidobacteriota bacterium]|nr:ABC transporter permease [Acidobacteriota bacterium]